MRLLTLVFFSRIVNACITVKPPTLIDRATVMEAESAGKWPAFEKKFLDRDPLTGPIPFPKEESSRRKNRVYSILNGDFTR